MGEGFGGWKWVKIFLKGKVRIRPKETTRGCDLKVKFFGGEGGGGSEGTLGRELSVRKEKGGCISSELEGLQFPDVCFSP